MHRRSLLLGCAAAGALVAFDGGAAEIATDSPAATITSLQARACRSAARQAATIEERYRALEPLIVATHDLPYIAEFALRRQWGSLTGGRAAALRRSVPTLERHDLCGALRQRREPTRFARSRPAQPDANGRVQVTTAIKREGQPDVSLEYLVQQDAGRLAHHQHRRRRRQRSRAEARRVSTRVRERRDRRR